MIDSEFTKYTFQICIEQYSIHTQRSSSQKSPRKAYDVQQTAKFRAMMRKAIDSAIDPLSGMEPSLTAHVPMYRYKRANDRGSFSESYAKVQLNQCLPAMGLPESGVRWEGIRHGDLAIEASHVCVNPGKTFVMCLNGERAGRLKGR